MSVVGILTVTTGGWGRHIWDTPQDMVSHARYYSFFSQIFFTTSVALTKLSILMFYRRFCNTTKTKWAIITSMVFVVGWFLIWLVVIFLQCTPVKAYWHWPEPGDRCTSHEDALHLVSCLHVKKIQLFSNTIQDTWQYQPLLRRSRLGFANSYSLEVAVTNPTKDEFDWTF